MTDVEAIESVQINGTSHFEATEPVANEKSTMEVPIAKLEEIVVTDYIRESLGKVAINEGFKDYDLVVDHGSSIGDGFVGIILRATITEKDSDKTLKVLAKIPPTSEARRKQMKVMPLFEREAFVYNTMLPEFAEFQKEKKINQSNGFFNFAKVYYADYDKEKDDGIIIMEDLRESGYRMWNKFEPINIEHAKLLMTALGRLHAISFAMKAKKPELFEKYRGLKDYFSEGFADTNFTNFLEGTVAKAIETLDPNNVKMRARASKLLTYLRTDIFDCMNSEIIEPFAVVNHGDCWINNYLFHYTKNGTPKNIALIDWQISRYCSPVIDLVYFIFICTDHDTRVKHYDELLSIYHHSLKELLDHLGGDTMVQFPFTALLRHLKKFGKFGIVMACMILPMLQVKSDELMDLDFMAEKMVENDQNVMDDMMKQFIENSSGYQVAVKRLRDVLEDAIRYGYL